MHNLSAPIHNIPFIPDFSQLMLFNSLSSNKYEPLRTLSQNHPFTPQLYKRTNPYIDANMSSFAADPHKRYKADIRHLAALNNMADINTSIGYENSYFTNQFNPCGKSLLDLGQMKSHAEQGYGRLPSRSKPLKGITSANEVIILDDDDKQGQDDDECFIIAASKPIVNRSNPESLTMKDHVIGEIESAIYTKRPQYSRLNSKFGHQGTQHPQFSYNEKVARQLVNQFRMQSEMENCGMNKYHLNSQTAGFGQHMKSKNQISSNSSNFSCASNQNSNIDSKISNRHSSSILRNSVTQSLCPIITLDDEIDETKLPEQSSSFTDLNSSQKEGVSDMIKIQKSVVREQSKSESLASNLNMKVEFQEEILIQNLKVDNAPQISRSYRKKSIKDSLNSKFLLSTVIKESTEMENTHNQNGKNDLLKKIQLDSTISVCLESNEHGLIEAETMIGTNFQAKIPKFCLNKKQDRKVRRKINLKWNPEFLESSILENFMKDLSKVTRKNISNEEIALRTLQSFGMDVENALAMIKRNKIYYRHCFEREMSRNKSYMSH